MSVHMSREVEQLKRQILTLGTVVEENVWRAVKSVEERDTRMARRVIDEIDDRIDKMEVAIEEDCLKVLALYQPVAGDLRFIVSVLKINADLERIGDLAVNIAERAVFLAEQQAIRLPAELAAMAASVQTMLSRSLDALVNLDARLARHIIASDADVDAALRSMFGAVRDGILERSDRTDAYLAVLSVSRHLERVADHATNIAEDVIYMAEGEIVRHRGDQQLVFEAPSERG